MKAELTVSVHIGAFGKSYARTFPTVSAARAFVLRRHDQNGVSDMWIEVEGCVVAKLSDILSISSAGWSEAADNALFGQHTQALRETVL